MLVCVSCFASYYVFDNKAKKKTLQIYLILTLIQCVYYFILYQDIKGLDYYNRDDKDRVLLRVFFQKHRSHDLVQVKSFIMNF